MIQRNYEIEDFTKLDALLDSLSQDTDLRRAKHILLKIFMTDIPVEEAKRLHGKVKEALPAAKVISLSSAPMERAEQARRKKSCLLLNCCLFFTAEITILECGVLDLASEACAMEYGGQIALEPNIKGVEMLCAGANEHLAQFLDILTEQNEEIPFWGAEAGISNWEELAAIHQMRMDGLAKDGMEQYVIGTKCRTKGAVMILYCGENLHIKADYVLGWKPLGKEMVFSEQEGANCIVKIDGVPAAEIYRRYLKVEPDAYFLFNISEFPLMINRNDCLIARVPPIADPQGRLHFVGDVWQGEKVRLSYGNPRDILEQTKKSGEEMRTFSPEGIFLTICGNRNLVLRKDSVKEVGAYQDVLPDTAAFYSTAEIYKHHGCGGVLNNALIAVGLREGEMHEALPASSKQAENNQRKIIPLHIRLANFLDATAEDLKESNREMRKLALEARSANRAKSQFLSGMSHEIRTPINAVLGMDEMILRESTEDAVLDYAENIRTAGNTLLGLVNDILDFSKIEAGKMDILPVEYEIGSLINDLVTMIRKRAEDKGLELIVEASPKLPRILCGDEIRIKQIITNILTNAVKYTERGSVTLQINAVKEGNHHIQLHVSVRDTGIGIKKENIRRLFTAFERIEEKRNRSIEGTGLGISITQRLLSLMGSKLEVESTYGQGSTFTFCISQQVVKWEPLGDFMETNRYSLHRHKRYREQFVAPEARILVVDDTEMNLVVLANLLKQTKVQMDTAKSGEEGLAMAAKTKYDVIFLDYVMPGMDGIETLERLSTMGDSPNRETPTIALTANAVSGARQQYIAAGFMDYLPKPIDSQRLEQLLMEYLPAEKVRRRDEAAVVSDNPAKAGIPQWLQAMEGISAEEGIRHCGSLESYLSALDVFSESLERNAEEIETYFRAQDWKNYTVKVHALKSTAKIIGAGKLSDLAKRMEDAGNAKDVQEIRRETGNLLELYRSYLTPLSVLHPADNEAEKQSISAEELSDAYNTLREMVLSFDDDSIEFLLESLDKYRLPSDIQNKHEKLKSAIRQLKWEEARKLLDSVEIKKGERPS